MWFRSCASVLCESEGYCWILWLGVIECKVHCFPVTCSHLWRLTAEESSVRIFLFAIPFTSSALDNIVKCSQQHLSSKYSHFCFRSWNVSFIELCVQWCFLALLLLWQKPWPRQLRKDFTWGFQFWKDRVSGSHGREHGRQTWCWSSGWVLTSWSTISRWRKTHWESFDTSKPTPIDTSPLTRPHVPKQFP